VTDFSPGEHRFCIEGPSGQLDVMTMLPRGQLDEAVAGVVTVICHPHSLMGGTMNNKVVHTIARCRRDRGHRVVRFNFRGVEKSEGEYAEGIGESDDLLAVMAWVKSIRPNDEIRLSGFSFGAYVAARTLDVSITLGFKVGSLLLVAPAVENYNFDAFLGFCVPLSVIMGQEDEVVAPVAVDQWFDRVVSEKAMLKMPGAGHFFHGQLSELKQYVERLSGSPSIEG